MDATIVLKQIDALERELIKLKKNVLLSAQIKEKSAKKIRSLYGSVKAGDITEAMIEESKKNLFRTL
jgi:hypothetical protein